jgi:S1/P1 Nuclease
MDPGTFPTWTTNLYNRINQNPDSFLSSPQDWIQCIDPSNIEECALSWAKESNSYTCSYVYREGYDQGDLAGDYFTGAVPIVETQVAKGTFSHLRPPSFDNPFSFLHIRE